MNNIILYLTNEHIFRNFFRSSSLRDILNDQNITQQSPEYDDLSYLEKMKILVNQQLDKLIDPETKESFNEATQSKNADASEAAKRLEDILNQEQMTEIITTKTAADVRGMIVKYGNFAADQNRGKKPEVCIVTKWSPGLLKMADAIATNDFKVLKSLNVSFETKIISAHRTPKRMYEYAINAEKNHIGVIIAGAGGSAHLPGMVSALTSLPVLGVPIKSKKLEGLDSLLSIVQMPKGIPVGTLAIGEDGAVNSALLAASIISNNNPKVKNKLRKWRLSQTKSVKKTPK